MCTDCWGKDCPLLWSFKWHENPYKWIEEFIRFFFQAVIFTCFVWKASEKAPAPSPWTEQILDSLLNITFIQLSTHHYCFFLAHVNLIFFYLFINVGFLLAFLYVTPISFSRFLTVQSQTLILVSTQMVLICYVVHFLFYKANSLRSQSWYFDVFRNRPGCFPFSTTLFLLYLHPILDTADREQPTSFTWLDF